MNKDEQIKVAALQLAMRYLRYDADALVTWKRAQPDIPADEVERGFWDNLFDSAHEMEDLIRHYLVHPKKT